MEKKLWIDVTAGFEKFSDLKAFFGISIFYSLPLTTYIFKTLWKLSQIVCLIYWTQLYHAIPPYVEKSIDMKNKPL